MSDWQELAACKGRDTDAWFPAPYDRRAIAAVKRVCAACPVREQCLAEAVRDHVDVGVWGGLTVDERRRLRRG